MSSGTAAIQTALFSLNIKGGDKVIVSSICPSMSVVPIIALGAIPVFCDTNEDDFGLNINYLEKNNIPSDIKKYKFKVLYEYSLFKKYKRVCQNSKKLSQKITTIPVHPGLNKLELDYIVRVTNNFT